MMVFLSIPTSLTRSIPTNSEVFCKRSRILEYLWRVKIRNVQFCTCKRSCSISTFKTNLSGYTTSGIFRIVQPCTEKYRMSYSKKQPLATSPLPPKDESLIEDGKSEVVRKPFQQEEGMLLAHDDEYDGVIVDPNNLPSDVDDFVSSLKVSLSKWRQQGKKGVWIKVPITHAKLVPAAIEEGFWYHHAEPTYVMLAYWIPQTSSCTLPPNASHQVGVGGFVLNDRNQVLVVQEKYGPFRGTGVWKIPTGVIHQGEDIFSGAIREIKEETGVDTQFVELVGFRHSHHAAFEKSDLFFLCILQPISSEIVVQELEIDKAQWMPVEDFVSQPYYKEHHSLKKMIDICIASSKKQSTGFSAVQTVSAISNLPTVCYYNIADVS